MIKKLLYGAAVILLFAGCSTTSMEKKAGEKDAPSAVTVDAEEKVPPAGGKIPSGEEKPSDEVTAVDEAVISDEVWELKKELSDTKEILSQYVKRDEYVYDIEPVVIETTRYIVVDRKDFEEEGAKPVGREAVRKSRDESIATLKEFTGGMSIFDYDENYQFPVFTKKLSMTTIILNDDEAMVDTVPFMSDTVNWEITGDIWATDKGERQLIMVKPKETGLETNMLIVTDRRLYHFVLYSTKEDYQPMVKFRYAKEPEFITSKKKSARPVDFRTYWETVDRNMLSFNYTMTVPFKSRKVIWKPELVYDDGSHTYILLPEVCLQKEIPGVWEGNCEITNYEFHPEIHNLIVINRLVEKVTLRVGKRTIVIKKKKGMPQSIRR